jgi:integrase
MKRASWHVQSSLREKTLLRCGSSGRPRASQRSEYRFENPGRVFLRNTLTDEARHIDTRGEVWAHNSFGRIDWRSVRVCEPLKRAFQHFIFHELEASAPRSAFTTFRRLLAIQRVVGMDTTFPFSHSRVLQILVSLKSRALFHQFVRFYRWASVRGVPGFDRQMLHDISDLCPPRRELHIDARSPGRYLTDYEQHELLSALEVSRDIHDPLLRDQVLVQLCWELGCRPEQARAIDERHVHLEQLAGEDYWSIDILRAKQRVGAAHYKRRPISTGLAEKILLLVSQNRKNFGSSAPSSALFRTRSRINIRTKNYAARMAANAAAAAIAGFLSEALGRKTARGARTLRHNMAQRMADIGAPAAAVAEALDHSNVHTVDVYVRSKPGVAVLKARALGRSRLYREVIEWLNGRVPVPRACADSGSVVQGMVADRYIGNIGACGLPKEKTCSSNPVYSCYGCQQFTPFIDGDHGAVATAMAQENLHLLEAAGIEGNRVALANEYPIAAARAVQALCDKKRGTKG